MRSRRTAFILTVAFAAVTLGTGVARAQLVVFDPAVTLKNAAIAVVKEGLLDALADEADRLHQMAKRLSAFTDLRKYWVSKDDTPRWRIHAFQFEKFVYVNGYDAALNYG